MKESIKLVYNGDSIIKPYIIKTNKILTLKPGDSFEVTQEEYEELMKSRIAKFIGDIKKTKKSLKEGGD